MSNWIKVKDHLPPAINNDTESDRIFFHNGKNVFFGYYDIESKRFYSDETDSRWDKDEIIAWTPAPYPKID